MYHNNNKTYKMENLKLSKSEQQKISLFLSKQLRTLKTEKRIGKRYYNQADPEIIKLLENTIVSIAEEIYTDN